MGKFQHGLKITDTDGSIHTLDQEIGKGGQGVVWTLQKGNLAVKFLKVNKSSREEAIRRIQRVRSLDLSLLPISVPWIALQAPAVGYIMKLVRGLKPICILSQAPQESVSEWYITSGGLRWRLRILSAIAEIMANIHSKGLAFADPSPNNFMISPDPCDFPKVYLIDADNMASTSQTGSRILYTPRYGAPELVNQKSGVTTLTDAHAFAVLAFELLALSHPLIGDDIADGEPEEEEKALAGHTPWVDHSSDNSNWSERGIAPREIVLSPRIQQLFKKTFEDGLNDPQKRPGMGQWAEVLRQAADMTVCCNRCTGSYYFNKQGCPWCDAARDNPRLARFYIWDPEYQGREKFLKSQKGANKVIHAIALQKGIPQKIYKRHFISDPLSEADTHLAEITLIGKEAIVRNLGSSPLYARSFPEHREINEIEIPRDSEHRIPADGKEPRWYIHINSLNKTHRVLSI